MRHQLAYARQQQHKRQQPNPQNQQQPRQLQQQHQHLTNIMQVNPTAGASALQPAYLYVQHTLQTPDPLLSRASAPNPAAQRPQWRAPPSHYWNADYTGPANSGKSISSNSSTNNQPFSSQHQFQPGNCQAQRAPAGAAHFQRAPTLHRLPSLQQQQQQVPQACFNGGVAQVAMPSATQMQALQDLATDLEGADGALDSCRERVLPNVPQAAPVDFSVTLLSDSPVMTCPGLWHESKDSNKTSAAANGGLHVPQSFATSPRAPRQQQTQEAVPEETRGTEGPSRTGTAAALAKSVAIDITTLDAAQVRALYLLQVCIAFSHNLCQYIPLLSAEEGGDDAGPQS